MGTHGCAATQKRVIERVANWATHNGSLGRAWSRQTMFRLQAQSMWRCYSGLVVWSDSSARAWTAFNQVHSKATLQSQPCVNCGGDVAEVVNRSYVVVDKMVAACGWLMYILVGA
jgi:hypothetical protein